MEITKNLVEKLKNDNISKKEYDAILSAITLQVDKIWRFIIESIKSKLTPEEFK